MSEIVGAEVQIFGRSREHVADRMRVLTVIEIAVGIEEKALTLKRTRHGPLIPVGDHVGVVKIKKGLAAQQRLFLNAVEKERSHEVFLAFVKPDCLLQFS